MRRATREASEDALYASAVKRLEGLKATGVTTVEIKSGYGLDHDSELKMLRVALTEETMPPPARAISS